MPQTCYMLVCVESDSLWRLTGEQKKSHFQASGKQYENVDKNNR